jgi:hypothetical protein
MSSAIEVEIAAIPEIIPERFGPLGPPHHAREGAKLRFMPRIEFQKLPDDARLWVFACDPAPSADAERQLFAAADHFLNGWQAHGSPLTCAREWRDGRFLAIAVDQRAAGASGCSIDALFNALRALEPRIGSRVVGGGNVFYRDSGGTVRCVTRDEFSDAAARGEVNPDTPVFDTSITSAEAWRERFELPARDTWMMTLVGSEVQER